MSEASPKFYEIPKALALTAIKGEEFGPTGVTISSEKVQPGEVFVAIRGKTQDGHRFCQAALEKGASAVVVEDPELFSHIPRGILVSSTQKFLGPLASWYWGKPSEKLSIVAVTGTNGKTTTTHLLQQAWQAAGHKTGLIGTVKYHVGEKIYPAPLTTPDALTLQKLWAEMVEQKVEYASIEASSIALDQARIFGTEIKVGVFTNFTQDHLDYHGDMGTYLAAKRKLFTHFALEKAVVSIDDEGGRKIYEEFKSKNAFSFSVQSKADFYLKDYQIVSDHVQAVCTCLGKDYSIKSRLLGHYNAANLLGAAAALYSLGWDLEKIFALLPQTTGAPGRLERVGKPGRCEVLVDYAHSEDALHQVLKTLGPVKKARGGKIITVFGCGGDRDPLKRPKMGATVSQLSDVTVATSDNPRTEDPDAILNDIEKGIFTENTQYVRESNRREAIYKALQLASPNDIVLIAGKGHEDYQIIGTEKRPFDDKAVVSDYFADHVL